MNIDIALNNKEYSVKEKWMVKCPMYISTMFSLANGNIHKHRWFLNKAE
jgi:hypothetical protein